MTGKALPFLPYGRHCTDQQDAEAVAAVILNQPLTTGPCVQAFESALARCVGASHAVTVASGTAALHLAALAAGLGPGKTAIVPAITFAATANAPRLTGAEVVFADVDPESGLMRPQDVEAALQNLPHARADVILPVHLAGWCADMPSLAALAAERKITIIEDACHALGSLDAQGTPAGSCRYASLCAFSFHPVKTIAMGEGGAITTASDELADHLRRLRGHGIERDSDRFSNRALAFGADGQVNPWYYEMTELGLNYRASDLHCALGLSQLAKLDHFIAKRLELSRQYDALLLPHAPGIRSVTPSGGGTPGRHLYSVLIDFTTWGKERGKVMRDLAERNIGTQVHYIPVPWQPYYRARYGDHAYPGAGAYYERCLSLPLYPAMTGADVERVVETLVSVLHG